MLRNLFSRLLRPRAGLDAALQCYRAGELEAADALCAELVARAEPPADAFFLRGLIAEKRSDLARAAEHFEAAVKARSADVVFRMRLAQVLAALRRGAEARPHLERALELTPRGHPNRAILQSILVRLLADLGEETAVESLCQAMLAEYPEDTAAMSELGLSLYRQARTEEARAQFHRLATRTGSTAARMRHALMLPHINESVEQIEAVRARLGRDLDELIEARLDPVEHPEHDVGLTAFFIAYHGKNDRELLSKLARLYRKIYPARREGSQGRAHVRGRLRIGFVSRFFYGHSIARTTHGLIRDLPRDRFEVFVLSIAAKDDEWSRRIRGDCDCHVALPEELAAVRRAIESAKLDVLFFADLGMDALTYFLAFWRLAPLQLTTWGHPVTSGIDTIDAFVSAAGLESAGSEDQYSEALLKLPAFYNPGYRRPAMPALRSRSELGLPAKGPLYLCPQFLFKLHPDFDAALAAILRQSPDAQILLLAAKREAKARLRQRMDAVLGAEASRVHFLERMPTPRYYEVLAAADVVLDPFHFGGNNTTCEAFAFGKPIVTLPARFLRGRYTLACYREMQIDDGIASSPDEFVRIAVALGRDDERRAALSARILERSAVLFERSDAARALADAITDRLR